MSYFRKYVDIFYQITPISIFGRRSKKRKIRFDINFSPVNIQYCCYQNTLLSECVKPVIKSQVSIFPKPTLLTCHLGRAGLNAKACAILPAIST